MKLSGVPVGFVRGRSMHERIPAFPEGDTMARARGVLIYEPTLILQVARGLRTAMRVSALAESGHPHRDFDDRDSITARFVSLSKSAFFLQRLLEEPNYEPGKILAGDDVSAPMFDASITSLHTLGPVIEFGLQGRECEMVLCLKANAEVVTVLEGSKAKGVYGIEAGRIKVGSYMSAKRVEFALNAATGLGVTLLSWSDKNELAMEVREAMRREIGFLPFWGDGYYSPGEGNTAGDMLRLSDAAGILEISELLSRRRKETRNAGLLLWRFKRVLPKGLDEAAALRRLAQLSRAIGEVPS